VRQTSKETGGSRQTVALSGAHSVCDEIVFIDGKFLGGKIKNMKYSVIIHKSEYGYDVHVPALPGCHSQGETEKEALKNIQDAILTYLAMGKEELKGAEIREVEIAFA